MTKEMIDYICDRIKYGYRIGIIYYPNGTPVEWELKLKENDIATK